MGLYRRGKVWWYTIMRDGRRTQLSTKTDNNRRAKRIYAKAVTDIAEGNCSETVKINYGITFKELAEKYLAYKKPRVKSERSVDNETRAIAMLTANIGWKKLNSISVNELEQIQTDALDRNKPATVNRKFDVLKHMFTKAADWDMITEDTLKRVRRVKRLKANNARLRYLSKEECVTLIDACDSHLKPIVITALSTGMRRGEILSLKWDNVDLRHGFILLDRTKNGERREIPVNDTLRDVLQGLTRRLDIPYVFFDAMTGKPYQEVKRSFHSALRRAGIRDFRFHDLRHTFASQLVMAGVDITTVSKLLGHKSLTMTLRYSHLAPSHLTEAVKKIEICYNFTTMANSVNRAVAVTP